MLDDSTKVKFWQFSGGEIGCRLEKDFSGVEILSVRMTTPDAPMRLALLLDAMDRADYVLPSHLTLGYVPYGRQDKIHTDGEPLSIKVFAKIIDSFGFNTIRILDPHSDAVVTAFNTTVSVDDGSYFARQFMSSKKTHIATKEHIFTIIVPDMGASKRARLWADNIDNVEFRFFQVDKVRDKTTGRILDFHFLEQRDQAWWDESDQVFILDDICDRGGTFHGILDKFSQIGITIAEKIHLYVSHGIFPDNSLENLLTRFKSIGTTNSFKEIDLVYQEKNKVTAYNWLHQ